MNKFSLDVSYYSFDERRILCGINDKYIGKTAKVESEITANSGVITIYGERWEARVEDSSIIPQGSEVKIVRNESIIMFVQKI